MTKKFIEKVNTHFENHGYSLYATMRKDTHEFIDFIFRYFKDISNSFYTLVA